MTPIIKAVGLGKKYRAGNRPTVRPTLREALTDSVKGLIGRNGRSHFNWALRDISFEVRAGEMVGIVGRNGAGKSTLLRIVARITRPTAGYADIFGHVSGLLGVGTGFHPDLTGRENIYLGGAILGMKRVEVARKFDEIVAFSGLEDSLDMQAKRYSSGMSLRLAFSVAAHLTSDVLLIDEVLSAADADFRQNCLERIKQSANNGVAVLFVSHNLETVAQLCQRALHLDAGQLVDDGKPQAVISKYLGTSTVPP